MGVSFTVILTVFEFPLVLPCLVLSNAVALRCSCINVLQTCCVIACHSAKFRHELSATNCHYQSCMHKWIDFISSMSLKGGFRRPVIFFMYRFQVVFYSAMFDLCCYCILRRYSKMAGCTAVLQVMSLMVQCSTVIVQLTMITITFRSRGHK